MAAHETGKSGFFEPSIGPLSPQIGGFRIFNLKHFAGSPG